MVLCKFSDDQNVYGADDGSVVAYSAGVQHRYQFADGVWAKGWHAGAVKSRSSSAGDHPHDTTEQR